MLVCDMLACEMSIFYLFIVSVSVDSEILLAHAIRTSLFQIGICPLRYSIPIDSVSLDREVARAHTVRTGTLGSTGYH
jgi:hypothetical protein